MGKMILCSGSRAKYPYRFTTSGLRVYSMEELCYYLYHHVYQIEEEMFCDSLIEWIGEELKLTERAQKLKQLKKQKADVKTLVAVILCSTDYYTEHEIKSLLKTLDEIVGLPLMKRSCSKAKHCLSNHQYLEAMMEYEKILRSDNASELSPEEYGDILHNLAVAKAHISGLSDASELFCQAYLRNQRMESLFQYLFSLKLMDNDALYNEKREEYQVSGELHNQIQNYLAQMSVEAGKSNRVTEIHNLRQCKQQGNIREYEIRSYEILEEWKEKIRL